ncbi:uncharacterized protein E0L32_007055 [Thyridium curvatum]|uniref:Cupin type-2 domain-containing protein n=1 Tax=Thyridium curvatum TaxID=1093900 RepID=A0A507B4A1_9PEZI|nr:uncharacterized protein E0L32_007055 [Thyridium curvatum]TPX12169.1 hypothetical protein E0L32_007055 [Thyridium curvatum]
MTDKASTPRLPNPRRVITDTNPDTGLAGFSTAQDESLGVTNDLGGSLFRLGYVADRAPQALDGADLAAYGDHLQTKPPLFNPGDGATVWYVDTAPGGTSPMHRTVSLDVVVLLEGEIELTLDSGEKRLLRPGDMTVQRATMHAWRNPSADKWARMVAVMAESQPVKLSDGRELGTHFPPREGK